jgi:radical SAM superfamily enzyme YgiQ (UPF0313 family)
MLGSPGEKQEDIDKTFEVMKWLKADYIHMTIFTPFPGTEIYLNGLKNGIIGKDYWKEFAENPVKDFIPPHWDEYFTLDELRKLLMEGYKQFYLRPRYILKILFSIRSLGEFIRKSKAGVKVLLMKK